ncbi:MAG: proton-conducting transporter membrane subunit [Leptospirales bacterium]
MSWILVPFALLGLSIAAQTLLLIDAPKRARIWLIFQAAIGASLALIGGAAVLSHSETMYASAPALTFIGSGISFAPTLYLDARNGLLLLMLGLTLPLVFFWLRRSFAAANAAFFIPADLLTLGLVGAFLADSLILFYVFFEVALIGAYFWIGLQSDEERRPEGGGVLTRFLLFTLLGSLAMLASIGAILSVGGGGDARISNLSALVAELSPALRFWTGAGFFLAFAIKAPLFLFHGWMRETYRGSPAAARAVLSAGMSKLGVYGFLMILVPAYVQDLAAIGGFLQVLAVGGVIYGAMMCLAVKSFRDVLIFSSLTHLNLIALGVFSAITNQGLAASPMQAALFQMFNHGLLMGALFALEGRIARNGGAEYDFGGLHGRMPRLSAVLLLTIFVAISLPGTGSFAAELLILFAAYRHSLTACLIALFGLLVAAAALVRVYHRNFLGAERGETAMIAPDLSPGEASAGLLCGALWIVTGFYPMLILGPLKNLTAFGI